MHHYYITTPRTVLKPDHREWLKKLHSCKTLEDDLAYDNLSADDLARGEDYQMAVIFNAIRIATRHECYFWRGRLCPKLRKLWLEMIEGNDPTDHDVWLWWAETKNGFESTLVDRS